VGKIPLKWRIFSQDGEKVGGRLDREVKQGGRKAVKVK
jgi:methionine-rich copper-binding protein CopC